LKIEVPSSEAAWETLHAAYDQSTYQAVLGQVRSSDVILDIGAGDLRLARRMARIARKVYAVEINAEVLDRAYLSPDPLPATLIPIHADARSWEFPCDITAGVLLMRHCTCFRLYAEKLQIAGAAHLITNARWRMAVETVNLQGERTSFASVGMGWFACLCGKTGFKEGPAEQWTPEMDNIVHEVSGCPQCECDIFSLPF
jgi:hypothetical protein